jgi:hypothetical protein
MLKYIANMNNCKYKFATNLYFKQFLHGREFLMQRHRIYVKSKTGVDILWREIVGMKN